MTVPLRWAVGDRCMFAGMRAQIIDIYEASSDWAGCATIRFRKGPETGNVFEGGTAFVVLEALELALPVGTVLQ